MNNPDVCGSGQTELEHRRFVRVFICEGVLAEIITRFSHAFRRFMGIGLEQQQYLSLVSYLNEWESLIKIFLFSLPMLSLHKGASYFEADVSIINLPQRHQVALTYSLFQAELFQNSFWSCVFSLLNISRQIFQKFNNPLCSWTSFLLLMSVHPNS